MEIVTESAHYHLLQYSPIALAIVAIVLVFTFGFKSTEQPPFVKLSVDDKKSSGKKRKTKDKKAPANGQVITETKVERSPLKDTTKKAAVKEQPVEKKEKKDKTIEKNNKNQAIKQKQIVEEKNKKNLKKSEPKPADFDDGDWETVPTKADKKKKSELSPGKTDKKKTSKKDIDKIIKDEVNTQLQAATETKIEPTEEIIKKEEELVVEQPPVIEKEEEKKDVSTKKEKKIKEKKPAAEEPAPVVVAEEKKERKKEPKPKKEEKANVTPVPAPKKEEEKPVIQEEAPAVEAVAAPAASGAVFDELGDVWTEAKTVKKSKKKARRDN